MVHSTYFKWLWSILLVNSICLVAFLLMLVNSGSSLNLDLHFGHQKWLKIIIFGQNRRLKVHNMYFKWLGSILLLNSISLVAFILISVHPGNSIDLWIFNLVPKMAKTSIFDQNRRLKVHIMHFQWFGSPLPVDLISLITFILISAQLGTSLDLWTFISGQKRLNKYISSKSKAQGQYCPNLYKGSNPQRTYFPYRECGSEEVFKQC